MNKSLPLLTALLGMQMLCATPAIADESLVVWKQDKTQVSYEFANRPKVTFDDEYLVLTAADVQVSYPLSDMWKFTFEASPITALSQAALSGKERVQISLSKSAMKAQGLKPGTSMVLFDLNGAKLADVKVDGNGCAEADIEALGSGVYVVKTSHASFKIRK